MADEPMAAASPPAEAAPAEVEAAPAAAEAAAPEGEAPAPTPVKAAPERGACVAGYLWDNPEQLSNYVYGAGKDMQGEKGMAGGAIDGKLMYVVYSLLERHPAAFEKMEGGVAGLGYGLNEEHPDTSAFYVLHPDGKKSYFSVGKAVGAVFEGTDGKHLGRKRRLDEEEERTMKRIRVDREKGKTVLLLGIAGIGNIKLKEALKGVAPDIELKQLIVQGNKAYGRTTHAREATELCEKVTMLCGRDVKCTLLEGKQEESFIEEQSRLAERAQKGGKKGKGKKGGKGGKGKGGKGKGGRDNGGDEAHNDGADQAVAEE